MSVVIDRESMEPLYEQLAQLIRERARRGEWEPGRQALPSEPDLADHYGVNRDTVRRAVAVLVEEGLLRVVRGKGTYVLPPEERE